MSEFQALQFREIDDAAAVALNHLLNIIRLEREPDDPPHPLDEDLQGWRAIPDLLEVPLWLAWDPSRDQIIAMGDLEIWHTPDNQHLAEFEINVHPDYRRHRWGSRLLHLITAEARRQNRRLMIAGTNSRVPAGAAFMKCLGATPGLEAATNQLCLDELDRNLLQRWLDVPSELRTRFSLGLWEGTYPEDKIPAVVELFQIANDAPHDQIEVEDRQYTAEMLRQFERHQIARGYLRWTYYVVENATGHFCGFTETFWNPNRPAIISQDFTGVHPEFRGLGLGRWLKAAMLDKVLRDRPQVTLVRTGNANSNAPMLAINNALGFKLYNAFTYWQVETEKAQLNLGSNGLIGHPGPTP